MLAWSTPERGASYQTILVASRLALLASGEHTTEHTGALFARPYIVTIIIVIGGQVNTMWLAITCLQNPNRHISLVSLQSLRNIHIGFITQLVQQRDI